MLSRFAMNCYRGGGGKCTETPFISTETNRDFPGVTAGVRTMVRTSLRHPPGQNLRQVVQRWQSTATAELANSTQVRREDRVKF